MRRFDVLPPAGRVRGDVGLPRPYWAIVLPTRRAWTRGVVNSRHFYRVFNKGDRVDKNN